MRPVCGRANVNTLQLACYSGLKNLQGCEITGKTLKNKFLIEGGMLKGMPQNICCVWPNKSKLFKPAVMPCRASIGKANWLPD